MNKSAFEFTGQQQESGRQRRAIYAGSFDPVTNGHWYMIAEGIRLFDHVEIVIADNPNKNASFSKDIRKSLVEFLLREHSLERQANVSFVTNRFIVSYAKECGATHLLRGVRNSSDFEYELQIRHINEDLAETEDHAIQTVFLIPPRGLTEVSSSAVKGLVGIHGWEAIVERYVPRIVLAALLIKERVQRDAKCRESDATLLEHVLKAMEHANPLDYAREMTASF